MRGGRDLSLLVQHAARTRDADDLELAPRGVGGRFELARDRVQYLGVRVVIAGRGLADDAAWTDEARERVDMAVGVVVQETLVDPNDLPGAEGLA